MTMKQRYFLITVDTEGDNMWRRLFSPNALKNRITIKNGEYLPQFQALCEKYGFAPTYLVNYEMSESVPLQEMARRGQKNGKLEIGMHMHAWSCPPLFELPIGRKSGGANPYIGEYPSDIIKEKVKNLTRRLKENFHVEATSHRSGRWQLDGRYAEILAAEGYIADCSVTPNVDWTAHCGLTDGSKGSDYRGFLTEAYEIDFNDIKKRGASGLFEVPVTVDYVNNSLTWLRPTGGNLDDMLTLVRKKYDEGADYVEFMLHSSEMMPFGSPNFRSEFSIEKLYHDMDKLFAFAAERFSGCTLSEYADKLKNLGDNNND